MSGVMLCTSLSLFLLGGVRTNVRCEVVHFVVSFFSWGECAPMSGVMLCTSLSLFLLGGVRTNVTCDVVPFQTLPKPANLSAGDREKHTAGYMHVMSRARVHVVRACLVRECQNHEDYAKA